MTPDEFIELFVSTIIGVVMLVVLAQLLYPNVGEFLTELVPAFIEVAVYLFVFGFLAVLMYQLVDEF